jgi:hypothetical protein
MLEGVPVVINIAINCLIILLIVLYHQPFNCNWYIIIINHQIPDAGDSQLC